MSVSTNTQLFYDPIRRTAHATTQRLYDCMVVTANGEIDAANAEAFTDYALKHLDDSKPLIVDLTQLEFFGTAGFSSLHAMNAKCAAANIRWAVSANGAVARILRICDPDGTLPVVLTLEAAKQLVDGDQAQLLKLVPEPS
ncbi:STAS domain-containing protein [Mycolicibacterium mengxianglii]|uniref:STAS domain-containing protein n=1 Tax=Mycolicibacterium mengxianglii TaxID=2736649 RepID=UPI0018EF26B7|nr:STAS domain-containing protein [Mycolicibacterium mengxianglii]